MRTISLAIFLTLLLSLPLIAQENVGTVSGTITDESGGVVPGVEISLTSLSTGQDRTALTGDSGVYTFNTVAVGEHSLTATMAGFRTLESTVRVVSGETVTVDASLSVGQVTDTVEVTATLPVIEKQSNKAGYARVTEEIARLPLSNSVGNREALDFLRYMPGVSFNPDTASSNGAMSTAFIQGTPNASSSYNIDGVRASSSTHQNARDDTGPIPELVQEFRLDTNTTAEHGWDSGVAVNLIFKSGTNDFHGDLFWYVQNDKLNARPWAAAERAVLRHNDFGFVLGGPIWKNRTFFMGGIDIYKYRTAASGSTATVATSLMRQGDFSELLTGEQLGTDVMGRPIMEGAVYDPMTTRSDGQGGFIRDPFPNNQIPSSRFSTITQNLQGHIGLPNQPGILNNWVGTQTKRPVNKESYYMKVDHQIDEAGHHKFSFGYEANWGAARSTYPEVFTEAISSLHVNTLRQYRYRFSYYWTIRPNILMNLRTGVTRTPRAIGTEGLDNDTSGRDIFGITGVNNPNGPFTAVSEGHTGYGPIFKTLVDPSQTNPVNLDVTWVKGSHNFKFGAAYLVSISKQNLDLFGQGSYNFSALETAFPSAPGTGYGFASQLLGEVASTQVWSLRDFRHNGGAWGFYFQDSWRVNSKLTINAGIRNDIFVPTGETYDRIGAFDQTAMNPAVGLPGALHFWGEGAGRNGFKRIAPTLWANFGPRLGFAYAMDDKTVFRASGGFMYFPLFGAMTSGFNVPFLGWALDVTSASLDGGLTPAYNWDDGFPDILPDLPDLDPSFANGNSVQEIPRGDIKAGNTMTVNTGIERDLGWGMAFRANYHGKFSHSLPSNDGLQLNQMDPSFLSLGSLLNAPHDSPEAIAAGITSPYEGFSGPVNQAVRPFPHMLDVSARGAPVSDLTYHALAMSLQKRYGQGLTFMVNHTISKALGNAGFSQQGHSFVPVQHTQFRHTKYLYRQDRTQIFAASWLWELPFGPGKRWGADSSGAAKGLMSGWIMGMTHNYFTGYPINVSSNVRYNGGLGDIWPVRNLSQSVRTGTSCGDYDPNNSSSNRYLNPDAFTTPAPFTFGDTRTLPATRGCSYFGENLTIQKDTHLTENVRLRFGYDAFNLFNRHQWGSLNTDVTNAAGFGRYSSSPRTLPRSGQFHISIHF